MIATSGFLTDLEFTKFVVGWRYVTDSTGVAYSAPRPHSWFKGACEGGGDGIGEGMGKGREGQETGGTSPFRKFLDPPPVAV